MSRLARWCLAVLGAIALAALLGPALAPDDAVGIARLAETRLIAPLASDAAGHFHLLGTDRFGRDLLVRMLVAARLSLAIGVAGSVLAALIGLVAGAVGGWRGGALDVVLMGAADTLLAVPRLVLLLVCAALWQPGTLTVVVVLAATGWMSVARLVRADVIGLANRPFVTAAQSLGASSGRVLWRHVVPNTLGPLLVATTLGVGNAILLESGLSFLGLVTQGSDSLGQIIDHRQGAGELRVEHLVHADEVRTDHVPVDVLERQRQVDHARQPPLQRVGHTPTLIHRQPGHGVRRLPRRGHPRTRVVLRVDVLVI